MGVTITMATDKQKILDIAQNSANSVPNHYNGRGEAHEPNCNDKMVMYITVNERKMIVDSGFELTEGACATVKATAAVAARLARDKPAIAAYTITALQIAAELTDDGELDKEHLHCAIMAELATKRAVVDYSSKCAPSLKN